MPTSRPQYYKNTLQPVEINRTNLKRILKELQLAVKQGTEVVRAGCPSPVDPFDYGSIYSGTPGTVPLLLPDIPQKNYYSKHVRINPHQASHSHSFDWNVRRHLS